jgi:DNA-binding NtrC family response regulator
MTEPAPAPPPGLKVLLAEDEKVIAVSLMDDLAAAGHQVQGVPDGLAALERLRAEPFDVLITDIRMPGLEGLELLRRSRDLRPDTAVLVITGYGTIESAVEAMKAGASEYIVKPFLNDEIVLKLQRLASLRELERENVLLREQVDRLRGFENIVGSSKEMQRVFGMVRTVAKTDANVLIQGESGTGKERIARALHLNSPRASRPFVALSCGALPETLLEDELFGHEKGAFTDAHKQKLGRFERAQGGTVFLDDIDDMPLPLQVKLLRVLQEREIERLGGEETVPVDVRVIAATKVDLEQAAREGRFREDLFYRLNVVPLRLPPLRERPEDIPLLAYHFIRIYGKGVEYTIDPETMELMCRYSWPGNVRELENAVERAIALAGNSKVLKREHLVRHSAEFKKALAAPTDLRPLRDVLAAAEAQYIREVLRATSGHKAQAAKLLGISRKNLWEKMREHGIEE